MIDEPQFQLHATSTLETLARQLAAAGDAHDFEADLNNGALTIEFEEPKAKFVVSPNAPVRQIWVSAHSRSYKLDWDPARETFVLASEGITLQQLLERAISQQLGQEVAL